MPSPKDERTGSGSSGTALLERPRTKRAILRTLGETCARRPVVVILLWQGVGIDYEVFLLSRVHEAWMRTHDSKGSVAHGLEITARVITCAALIMVSVFAAFLLGDDIVVKMLGLGLAVSVLVDATIVRLLLVPAVMTLLGPRAWWPPRRLDRILPHIDSEGDSVDLSAPGYEHV
ncbi:MAG TPA: MMPL family transporter [Actinocrinis sp.]|nr:MMPL family transporter [Actinocrinis sp.]